MIYELQNKGFWLDETIQSLLDYLQETGRQNETIVCAAGMTPSAPIHFGILREIAISSFVYQELIKQNKKAKLVYYWDDYDHFCKIPYYTTKEEVQNYLGKTLREVPDFNGLYQSYGEHYMREFEECLHKCGFFPNYNYQSELYKSGYYTQTVRKALNERNKIFDIINQTNKDDPDYNEKKNKYFPVEVYCEKCGTDYTRTISFESENDCLCYECKNCQNKGQYILKEKFNGKLAWKVNWASRWSDDKVSFESSGENQLTQTGSYSVSSKVCEKIFDGKVPFSLLYRFIGTKGIAKVSRAQGEKTLAKHFTNVLEPCIVRWLLVKNPPNKTFSLDIEDGIFRIYSEWDSFEEKVKSGFANESEKRVYEISIQGVQTSKFTIPFRTVIIALGIFGNDMQSALEQMRKMTGFKGTKEELFESCKPRILSAQYWLYECNHLENQVVLNEQFNKTYWKTLSEQHIKAIECLCTHIDDFENEELTKKILFNISKELGISEDLQEQFTRQFFTNLYELCLGKSKGPKLTTLLCLTKKEKLLTLLKA